MPPLSVLTTSSEARTIDQNGYQIVGPGRELNLRLPEKPGDQNDPNMVNEIQFPLEKVA